ncbi:unnamed protein product [Camellia sinensis]
MRERKGLRGGASDPPPTRRCRCPAILQQIEGKEHREVNDITCVHHGFVNEDEVKKTFLIVSVGADGSWTLFTEMSIEEHRIIASKPQLKSPSQPQLKLQSSQQQSGPQPQLQLQPQEKCQPHPKHVQGSYVRPPGPRLVSKNRYGYESGVS